MSIDSQLAWTTTTEHRARAARGSIAGEFLTGTRLRVWGVRSAMALVDQGFTSGAGFGVSVLLARWMPVDDYGAFAVAFACFLFASGFHNVLVLEPTSVLGSSRYSNRVPSYFVEQIRAHVFWTVSLEAAGLIAGTVILLRNPGSRLGSAILGLAASLPFLLLLLLVRRMCYVAQDVNLAVKGSLCNLALVIAGALILHDIGGINPFSAFVLLGGTSLLSSLVILHGLGILGRPFLLHDLGSFAAVLSENWQYGRWLTVTTALSWASMQSQTFFSAGLLGLSQSGILRAMQLPALAIAQVIAATNLLVLPSLARELSSQNFQRLHRKAVSTSVFLTAVGGIFVVALVLLSSPLEHLFYGGRYSSFAWLIPLLGLAPVCTGMSSIFSYALRALGKSQYELGAYICSACVAVGSSVTLIPRWGLQGAVGSILLSAVTLSGSVLFAYKRWGSPRKSRESVLTAAD